MTDNSVAPRLDAANHDALAAVIAGIRTAVGRDQAKARALPPVEKWDPDSCGDIGMEIRADGSWWHDGTRITRQPLIDLFSTVLRKDANGQTWLVTPFEKVIVHVADAHFQGVRVDQIGFGQTQTILVTTNVGDTVTIGPDNPLRVSVNPSTREPRPYVLIRGRLEAVLSRAAFYDMVEYGVERDGMFGVWSSGCFFEIDAPT